VRIERWDPEQALARASAIWTVYEEVFADRSSESDWLASMFDPHCARRGFRLDAAVDGDAVLGFAYGYLGDRGQLWPDRVALALGEEEAAGWLGGHFEFVELGVVGSHRRLGLGAALHDALMTDPPSDRALLSTDDDPESPAVQLYRSRGWQRLTLLEPGVQVMGRRLQWAA
jgi:ribosomal protein S18 acetylase RimI-like enzyme